jgi:hypothetical protein
MAYRLSAFYLGSTILSLFISALLWSVYDYDKLRVFLAFGASLLFLLDSIAWWVAREQSLPSSYLAWVERGRVAAALVTIGTIYGHVMLGPTQLVIEAGCWGFAVYGALSAWLLFYARINHSMFLGNLVRAWRLDVPKNEVAYRYSGLYLVVALLGSGLALRVSVKGVQGLGTESPEIFLSVILTVFLVIYLVVGPIIPILRNARRTVGANCFLSYASADQAFVDRLRDGLESHHVSCFQDKRYVLGGDELTTVIGRGIATSDVFIVVLSMASVSSQWVRDEALLALHYERLHETPIVIPLRLCAMHVLEGWTSAGDDVAGKIRARSIVDFEHVVDDWDGSMDRLRETLIAKTRAAA